MSSAILRRLRSTETDAFHFRCSKASPERVKAKMVIMWKKKRKSNLIKSNKDASVAIFLSVINIQKHTHTHRHRHTRTDFISSAAVTNVVTIIITCAICLSLSLSFTSSGKQFFVCNHRSVFLLRPPTPPWILPIFLDEAYRWYFCCWLTTIIYHLYIIYHIFSHAEFSTRRIESAARWGTINHFLSLI